MVTGSTRHHAATIEKLNKVVDSRPGEIIFGLTMLVSKGRTIFVADTNVHDNPTAEQALRVENFLTALGHLYPCPTCAAHFRSHIQHHPIVSSSREALSLWLCEAHNEVNLRNGKRPFYCDPGVLDARWKDCGCGNKTAAAAVVDALPLAPPTALPAANAAGVTWERRPTKRHGLRRLRAPLNAAAPLDV